MRRSFGGSSGGMGGGGGMIRNVHRVVRAGVGGAPPEPFSPSANTTTVNARANSRKEKKLLKKQPTSPKTALTLSSANNNSGNNGNGPSPFSSLINLPVSAASGAAAPSWDASSPVCSDDSDWGCVDGSDDEWTHVFGTVPSTDEVHHAVSALQQVFGPSFHSRFPKEKLAEDTDHKGISDELSNPKGFEKGISSIESHMDWIEPSLNVYNSRTLSPHGTDRVYDAFHLLQTEPSVQRMVFSLSSDRAVWDAVLNNEVVKEIRSSITQAENVVGKKNTDEGGDDSNPVNNILGWILVNAKTKIMQLVDKVMKIVNEVFHCGKEEKKREVLDPFEEKLKSSLLLSIVVLFMVVVARIKSS